MNGQWTVTRHTDTHIHVTHTSRGANVLTDWHKADQLARASNGAAFLVARRTTRTGRPIRVYRIGRG